MIRGLVHPLLLLIALAAHTSSVRGQSVIEFETVSVFETPSGGAEIIAYDPANRQFLVTSGTSIEFIAIDVQSLALGSLTTLDLRPQHPWLGSVSSVAVDPAGRGFAAAALIPTANTSQRGRIAFIDLASRSILTTIEVGYHPDCVAFTPSGVRLLTADEGERSVDPSREDPPGGISIIDLSSVVDTGDLRGIGQSAVRSHDFTASSLAPGVSLDGLRIAPDRRDRPHFDIEPEYLAPSDSDVWVSLQENNALARFRFATGQWDLIVPLGLRSVSIDASDRDGSNASTAQVLAMPMPDTIVRFRSGEREYLATVDEGDTRDTDEARAGQMPIDPVFERALEIIAGPDPLSDAKLGRLKISVPDSDPDGDGDLDRIVAFGTRSISIYDATTGALISETGGLLEQISRTSFPALFNADVGSPDEYDRRSDDRGPEPEALSFAMVGSTPYLFVGLERPGPLIAFDVSDPVRPLPVALTNHTASDRHGVAPEGSVTLTIDSAHYLAIAYEVSGTVALYRLRPSRLR